MAYNYGYGLFRNMKVPRNCFEELRQLSLSEEIVTIPVKKYTFPTKRLKSRRINHLSTNFTKWSNTLKQFVGNLPTNCLSVFDHFVGLALKGLIFTLLRTHLSVPVNRVRKVKLSIKDIFNQCHQLCGLPRIQSHLLRKSLMENFIFCAV